ncbi:hypothetical protein SAMN05444413_1172 [Roseivivax marinus]|uniref:hypothetical protein n=1 Tax=Roseivivax marinus TaxID=1379903 RepID=UPI0008AE9BBF|nr:hypothetical protein [Roseivivax marinus]SEL81207.1 hypothetical protein SAMN05444413_1172 [Roseivivax marinus]
MSGYQFAHMELWSAKPSNGNGPEPHAKKKNGERKWSAQEILDEAERIASASAHVIPGRPGPQILPRAASSFGDMRQMQQDASQVEESYIGGARGKKRAPRTRKLRVDAASLYASVFSLPVKTEAALADPDLRQSSLDVLEQALDWECDRIGKVGGRVLAGVVHWDEEHLHLHVFAIDPVRGRVDHLHPGRAAKAAVNMSAGPKSKARGKKANAAYCDAMRAWQDELHGEVFATSGLLRYGPGRHRWTRKEYGRAKALAADIASRETRLSDLEAWEGAQERRQDEQDARESDLDNRQTNMEEREAAAEEKVARAAAAQADALALRNALEVSIGAQSGPLIGVQN